MDTDENFNKFYKKIERLIEDDVELSSIKEASKIQLHHYMKLGCIATILLIALTVIYVFFLESFTSYVLFFILFIATDSLFEATNKKTLKKDYLIYRKRIFNELIKYFDEELEIFPR